MQYKKIRILLHSCALKSTVIFLLASKNGNLSSYRIMFSHPKLSLKGDVKCSTQIVFKEQNVKVRP